ncbi:bifunctional riboflavin kinase/FAD synthetase [Allonocardiopsis opalescens]|uniref:Riboflavin biosynthesis protein n=1 Tax=Allonocardiopsis opalescens TaxID=1144618 RepID=A0A2T0QFA3_9ACTN|nr:bifunctional riboflavin kinase/FAD synthetase [Allonocardiopsis opalescens]PRY02614.1 riboflavin kinase/FMN adenylyltransferase [Allonocardiopsis opalescens]
MLRWHGLGEVPEDLERSVVAVGVFDGVHRGHRSIVELAVRRARELGAPSVVLTFDPHPGEVLRPGGHPALLTTLRRRIDLLAGLGVDAAVLVPFTGDLAALEPGAFVRDALVERLHAATVVVGKDFRFGRGASGDVETLRELGEALGFATVAADLDADGVPTSSSRIRALVAEGAVAEAAALLGRPHRVEGVVVRGAQRGRLLGFPTANLDTPPYTAVPADGVYAGWMHCPAYPEPGEAAASWPAAISVGTNPTFAGEERTVEAYALDETDLDLYGCHVAVDFAERIRPMLRFDSVDELIAEMTRDVAHARRVTRPS